MDAREKHRQKRERTLAIKRASYRRNKARHIATCKAWAARNREKVRAIKRAWKKRNPAKVRAHVIKGYPRMKIAKAKWKTRNPGKVIDSEIRRRARKVATSAEDCSARIAILRRARFCHWCCDPMPLGAATIDHVVPLVRGGEHRNDNLVAACLTCNSSKGTKLLSEWREFKEAA